MGFLLTDFINAFPPVPEELLLQGSNKHVCTFSLLDTNHTDSYIMSLSLPLPVCSNYFFNFYFNSF